MLARRLLPLAIAAAAIAAAAAAPVAPATPLASAPGSIAAVDALEPQILDEVNALRGRHGLAPLRVSLQLRAAADHHSGAMAARGFFGHDSADGSAFWKRVQRSYGARGYRTWSVGENLLWASPTLDAQQALAMWMASPPHRRILLTPRWREIGISAVRSEAAPGVYGGRPATIVTANFGIRS